eukprot:jgi/Chlat1/8991/Chrsp94S08280
MAEEAMSALSVAEDGAPVAPTAAEPAEFVPNAKYSKRVAIKEVLAAGLLWAGKGMTVGGWVKTGREQGKGTFAFLELNDGSCAANLQVIVDQSVATLSELTPTGTCVTVEGVLSKTPEGTKQPVELRAKRIVALGRTDPGTYPIAKTKLSLEFLRTVMHLRSRTNTIAAIYRIRNALAYATHTFFQQNGFLYVHTPIVTASDCEGAGEMFQVTTLLGRMDDPANSTTPSEQELADCRTKAEQQSELIRTMKEEKKDKRKIKEAVEQLQKFKEDLAVLEKRSRSIRGVPFTAESKVDYSEDFFAKAAYLTVSGQLEAEIGACGLTSVYTFGPTFRAENSHTSRHLAEFWMVEPELAFADLQDDMNCAEDYVRFCCQWLLDHCLEDMEFFNKVYDPTALERLRMVASTPFERVSYTQAIELLLKVPEEVKQFEKKVEWGIDLQSEHERYLTEEMFKKPVIVYNYPKDIKAFYMRVNEDDKTVAAMDVLVPKVGELVGGSQREERFDVLTERIKAMGLPIENYGWYLDLRKYGTVMHAGFGLGFERLILFATGMDNIRDVIPFPRYPGHAEF